LLEVEGEGATCPRAPCLAMTPVLEARRHHSPVVTRNEFASLGADDMYDGILMWQMRRGSVRTDGRMSLRRLRVVGRRTRRHCSAAAAEFRQQSSYVIPHLFPALSSIHAQHTSRRTVVTNRERDRSVECDDKGTVVWKGCGRVPWMPAGTRAYLSRPACHYR